MIEKIGRWMTGSAVIVIGLLSLYLKGRSAGKNEERQEREKAINKQQVAARKIARSNEYETNSQTDSAVDIELERDWMRK